MGASRTAVIEYGGFSSGQANVQLHGAHTIERDERTLTCTYDVVLRGASETSLDTTVDSMFSALNARNQAFKITHGSVVFLSFEGDFSGTAGAEPAEFIFAKADLLGTHRTAVSRAYRITVEITRAAAQTGKTGVLSQNLRVTTQTTGLRRFNFRATFTPDPTAGGTDTALDRYADGTYGFSALVAAEQTTLTGTWERVGPILQRYDEDRRTLTASADYAELGFAQSASGTNDTTLKNVQYDVIVNRASAFGIPGGPAVQPFTSCTVIFSSGVASTFPASATDLNDAIDSLVLPYCKATVTRQLGLRGNDPITMSHTLRADPTNARISGQVFYLVNPGVQVLEMSKRISDLGRTGDIYVPVLDGTKWTRDKHTGPGLWTRRVAIAVRVLGSAAVSVLDEAEKAAVSEANAQGFVQIGWAVNSSPSREQFLEDLESIDTTVQTRVLDFVRADVRATGGVNRVSAPPAVIENAQGSTVAGHGERS